MSKLKELGDLYDERNVAAEALHAARCFVSRATSGKNLAVAVAAAAQRQLADAISVRDDLQEAINTVAAEISAEEEN